MLPWYVSIWMKHKNQGAGKRQNENSFLASIASQMAIFLIESGLQLSEKGLPGEHRSLLRPGTQHKRVSSGARTLTRAKGPEMVLKAHRRAVLGHLSSPLLLVICSFALPKLRQEHL